MYTVTWCGNYICLHNTCGGSTDRERHLAFTIVMGVSGLTTYLRENKRVLSETLQFASSSTLRASVIVDGWSWVSQEYYLLHKHLKNWLCHSTLRFIYELFHQSNLPWIYGGEYHEFSKLVVTVVKAWIDVGLKVFFVFDGTSQPHHLLALTFILPQDRHQSSSSQQSNRDWISQICSHRYYSLGHRPRPVLPKGFWTNHGSYRLCYTQRLLTRYNP